MVEALVVGANGFIGSHLVDGLSLAGHHVTAFDRFSSRGPTFAADADVVVGEFLNRADLEQAVQGKEMVFHFLSTTTPATAESDPTLDVRTNLAQSIELMEVASAAGVRHMYFASTGGAVYGVQGRERYAEQDPALPISPYAIGKLAIERFLAYFAATRGLRSTVFRISNPYGPRQHPHRKQGLIPIALRQILNGEPVVQFGDGTMVRDYIYVEDLIDMILPIVERGGGRHDLYNLGSGTGHTVTEVFDSLRRVTGIDFAIERRPVPPTFVDRVVLDTTRYTAEFGTPRFTDLDDGVRSTLEDMRTERQ